MFITNIDRSVKSFNKFIIFFVRLLIISKKPKTLLLIRKALRYIVKRII
jgi:hypothetical protein